MTYRRCRCPVWILGSVQGKPVRKALDTTSWEKGNEILRELDSNELPDKILVADAGERLIADCVGRKLAPETIGKYRLLVKEMKEFYGPVEIASVGVDDLSRYRESWKLSAVSAKKKIERLRTFFRFCMERGWTRKNPAVLLKSPSARFAPTLPFTDAEMEKILWACDLYLEEYPRSGKEYTAKLKAFVLLLRYSGLRIRDTVCLRRDAITEGKLFLYTQKTGVPVFVPLPELVLKALGKIRSGDFYFWSGRGTPKSAVSNWQRTLGKLFKLAGMEGHAHRFRDTFATALLAKGVSLENVSILLGHDSIKTTQKHYAPFVKSRQENLEIEVKKAWA
jgi:integrase